MPTAELDGADAFEELVRLAVSVDPQLASPPSSAAASAGAARSVTGRHCLLRDCAARHVLQLRGCKDALGVQSPRTLTSRQMLLGQIVYCQQPSLVWMVPFVLHVNTLHGHVSASGP